jgi:hypothetical protein
MACQVFSKKSFLTLPAVSSPSVLNSIFGFLAAKYNYDHPDPVRLEDLRKLMLPLIRSRMKTRADCVPVVRNLCANIPPKDFVRELVFNLKGSPDVDFQVLTK